MNEKKVPMELARGDFIIGLGHYKLSEEEVKYRESYFAFIDILGYKSIVQNLGDKAPWYFYRILKSVYESYKSLYEAVEIKLLSDSILIWSDNNHPAIFWNILNLVEMLRMALLKQGILIRGGISFASNFIDKDIIVSPALMEAYNLEQIAKMPRVLISASAYIASTVSLTTNRRGQSFIPVKEFARRVHPERVIPFMEGIFALRDFIETNGTHTLRTGLPLHYFDGDQLPTEEQLETIKEEGRRDLLECRAQLLSMKPESTDQDVNEKYSYILSSFNEWIDWIGPLAKVRKIEI